MKLFYFEGELNEENVFVFLEELSGKAKEDITIYFASAGGNPSLAYVFADSLWKLTKNDIRIKLIFYQHVHSACFFFLYLLNRYKEDLKSTGLRESGDGISWSFLDTSYGIMHSVTHNVDKEDNILFETETKLTSQINELFITAHSKKLTKQEKEAFKKGKEIVFDATKLQKLFGGDIIKLS